MAYTKFLHVFSTKQEHDTARSYGEGGEYHEPWVAYVNGNSKLVTYNKGWDEKYLTFEAIESGTFSFSNSGLSYSIDEGKTWTEIGKNANTPTINAGDRIMFKGVLDFIEDRGRLMGVGHFSSSNSFSAMGNPYSLLYGDNFVGVSDLTGKDTALALLFRSCERLISVENVALPATTLTNYCYNSMFLGCTSLTTAPSVLPATTLTNYCYYNMFNGCTSLATAPVLPATTLADFCYDGMFNNCTSLTTAPVLPATTLADGCYNYMFAGCTSLNYIKAMFTTTPSAINTGDWVNDVASTGTFVKNSTATWNVTGVHGVPSGWTVETASA